MKTNQLLAATMLATLAGCTTHLESGLADPANPQTRKGIAYFLPVTRFDADVTWTVTGCGEDGPVVQESIVAKTSTELDPDSLRTIDYASLGSFTKTSSVKVEFYDSGAIKSINASAEDRTGAIIGHAVSAASKLAAGFLPVGSGHGLVESEKPYKCSEAVRGALDALDPLTGAVEDATHELEIAQDTLEILTSRFAQAKSGKSESAVKALKAQIALVEEKKQAVQDAQEKLAPVVKILTYSDSVSFTANTPNATSEALKVPKKIWESWMSEYNGKLKWVASKRDLVTTRKADDNAIYLQIDSATGWQNGLDIDDDKNASPAAKREAGIRYRVAVPANLLACVGNPCTLPQGQEGTPGKQVGASMAVRVLSKGTTFYLPFASKGFSNGALEARFAENGTMTYAGYDQKTAPGEAIFAAADGAAGDVAGVVKGIRSGHKSELDQTKEETDLVKAKNDLALARAAQVKSPNAENQDKAAAIEAESKVLEAQVAKANAEVALRKAQAELGAAAAGDAK